MSSFASPLLDDDSVPSDLPDGKELEYALQCVNPDTYIPLFTAIYTSEKNSKDFVTLASRKYPQLFEKLSNIILGNVDWDEIDAALRRGRKIEAIKSYRTQRGAAICGLKEAKLAVENRMDALNL